MDSIWPIVASERHALAEDLSGITDAQWDTASLCTGWTVRDVLAHMTGTAKVSTLSFFPKLIGSGFRLTRMQEKDIERERGATPADTLAHFRSVEGSTTHPPGPTVTWLGEVIVHAEDIRQPLGIAHEYPTDALIAVAEGYAGSNLVMGSKRRIAGVTLRATDATWQHGSGPEAVGPMRALTLVVAGRMAALEDLTGDGVAVLASRT